MERKNPHRASATARMSNKVAGYQALRDLRNRGGSRLKEYEVEEDSTIFDAVAEEDYNDMMKQKLHEEDFVVDDDGGGYVDYGQNEWDEKGQYSSDEGNDVDGNGKRSSKGKRKRKPNEKGEKVRKEQRITSFLKKSNVSTTAKAPPVSTTNDDDLLNSILHDVDDMVDQRAQKKSKTGKVDPRRLQELALHGKTSEAKSVYTSSILSASTAGGITGSSLMSASSVDTVSPPRFAKVKQENMDGDNDTYMNATAALDEFEDNAPAPTGDDYPVVEVAAVEVKKETTTDTTSAPLALPDVKVKSFGSKAASTTTANAAGFVPKFAAPAPVAAPAAAITAAATTPTPKTGPTATATVVQKSETANRQDWTKIQQQFLPNFQSPGSSTSTTSMNGANGNQIRDDILEEDGSLRMYWIDATEVNSIAYVFGKVLNKKTNTYVSCAVMVKGIEHDIFVLPRTKMADESGNETGQEVEQTDVYAEFDGIRKRNQIGSWRAKFESRKYCFETPGIPAESDYLRVRYPYDQPTLPANLSGKSFSHVFGTNTSALETFILEQNLMGPCWVEIKNPEFSARSFSWCRIEIVVNEPKQVKTFAETDETAPKTTPPLVVMNLSCKTVMNHQKHVNEVVMASALVYHNVPMEGEIDQGQLVKSQHTVVRQLEDVPFPLGFQELVQQQAANGSRIEVSKNERALLGYLIAQIHRIDPDVIVGHNFIGFDLDVLLHRMKDNKIDSWSKIGRLRRSKLPKLQAGAGGMGDSTFSERAVASGRLLCDTYLAAKDLIKSKSYSLIQLASSQLGINREDIDFERIPQYFWNAQDLLHLIRHCEFDSFLCSKLMFKLQVLPLTKQLTNLAGNLWSRTMTGARAERNEYLLLHEFHKGSFILPDRSFGKFANTNTTNTAGNDDDDDHDHEDGGSKKTSTSARRKPTYAGGLVLEPKKGFYDKFVVMLDFNSLYPSIIQEFNICFTTVSRNYGDGTEDQVPEVPPSDLPQGILPRLLATLVQRRRTVKSLMKDPKATPAELAQYDIRQKALKLTANSMYGCLGFSHSRFFAKPLAMLITSKGREILQNTVNLAETEKLEVIYGDTDSIMIHTNTDNLAEVRKMGTDFKKAVNQRYKLLEIEMDGFYRKMLLLKKKKYAALMVEEKDGKLETVIETKGLDLVRRDWCGLSHDVSNFVLEQILSGANRDEILENIHQYLSRVGEETRGGLIPIEKFVINKALTKSPEMYADGKVQPHVKVALAMKQKGVSARVGDTIPYVICEGEASVVAARAYHPDDLKKADSGLKIDFEWYLSSQVHPPIARLIQPIEGTDSARIADCLGLDAAKYHSPSTSATQDSDELFMLDSQLTDEERFKGVEKFAPICRHCQQSHVFEPLVRTNPANVADIQISFVCPNAACQQMMPVPSLLAQLRVAIQKCLTKYQVGWMVCDDTACQNRTVQMSVYGKRCLVPGCKGSMVLEYTDTMLDRQLSYYESLFDLDRFKKACKTKRVPQSDIIVSIASQHIEELEAMRKCVLKYSEKSDRRYVDFKKLFDFVQVN